MLDALPSTDLAVLVSWLAQADVNAFFRTCRSTAALRHDVHALALWLLHVSACYGNLSIGQVAGIQQLCSFLYPTCQAVLRVPAWHRPCSTACAGLKLLGKLSQVKLACCYVCVVLFQHASNGPSCCMMCMQHYGPDAPSMLTRCRAVRRNGQGFATEVAFRLLELLHDR